MENKVAELLKFSQTSLEYFSTKYDFTGVINNSLKAVLSIYPLLDMLHQKAHRNMNPLIASAIRTFMAYVVFGWLEIRLFSTGVYILWALTDIFGLLYSLMGSRQLGLLRYKVSAYLFLIHSALEISSVVIGGLWLPLLPKYVLVAFLCFHVVSTRLLLRQKSNQMRWFYKSIWEKHQ